MASEVRPASPLDAARIAQIYNQSIAAHDSTMVLEPVDADWVIDWLARLSPRECLLVVSESAVVQGWGTLKLYSDRPGYRRAGETSVFLDREQRGRGLGSRVQGALMEYAAERGFHHLVAKIWAGNEGSLQMHYRFGYQMVGVQREIGWVDGKYRDVAILGCVLPEGPRGPSQLKSSVVGPSQKM